MVLSKKKRQVIVAIIGLLILSPFVTFTVLAWVFDNARAVSQWLGNNWFLPRLALRTVETIERWFGVDAETEHREWKQRMHERSKTKATVEFVTDDNARYPG